MATKWRIARSIRVFRNQIDKLAPMRSRSHDGDIGDAAHRARKSDHNPNAEGVVTAQDITHDPASGVDCNKIAAALQKSRDPRIKYIIWKGQIMSSKVSPWVWRAYNGPNKHMKHLHLSVMNDPKLYDDERPWSI